MKNRFLAEEIRIKENYIQSLSIWEKWGPYLSERAWGTVREDYSPNGDAWNYTSHEMARKYAYRWGEDGIAGFSDRYQVMCISFAFWNHKDPILKERLFGLAPNQTNHGEDVKEAYYYLDNVPSHAYMKYLYKYPGNAFPYEELIQKSKMLKKEDPEYEIYDTGIFDQDHYFDIFFEYAKISEEDLCIRVEVVNRSSQEAILDVLPQVCFRNTWSWGDDRDVIPTIVEGEHDGTDRLLLLDDRDQEPFPMLDVDYRIGKRYYYAEGDADLLFTNNETNFSDLGMGDNRTPYVKDAFHRYVIENELNAVNPKREGTKACFHYKNVRFRAKESRVFRFRLSEVPLKDPLANIDEFIQLRKKESDEYYDLICPKDAEEEEKKIFRQAISGQLWNKQLYLFIVNYWMKGDTRDRIFPPDRKKIRNSHWLHLVSKHVIVMPDKWEYPWFAAWDLAFHAVTLALVDIQLAKDQLWLLLTEQFQHPNGQIPAYEWEFSDLNPPVQSWAVYKIFLLEQEQLGRGDFAFLKKCYHKLVINFVWWVNREDESGNNVFEGGFLGLDNIGVIDRSMKVPGGGHLEQSDGTGWMGKFCLNMMRLSILIAKEDPDYEPMIVKFFQHFIYISTAMMNSPRRQVQNWSDEDGFFYDVISFEDGKHEQIPVRSLVGIIPLYAVDYWSEEELRSFEEFYPSFQWFLENRLDLVKNCIDEVVHEGKKYYFFSLMGQKNMKRILERVWDKNEFRSDYGLRSLSKVHQDHPVTLFDHTIMYAPRESHISMYGGNSNWRGPIWFPTSFLFVETLETIRSLFGDDYEIAAGVTVRQMRDYFVGAMVNIFKNINGRRAVFGNVKKMQEDPNFFDHLLFYEYFDGDTGAGLGASHQTGWTALVANFIHLLRKSD